MEYDPALSLNVSSGDDAAVEVGRVLPIREATDPDVEPVRIYGALGIDWSKEFPMQKRPVKN